MRRIIYALVVVTVLLSSCKKKEEETTTPDPSGAVLQSMSQVPSGISTTYSYDSEGRLQAVHNSSGSGMSISYSGDTVTETMTNDSGYVFARNILYLNTSGLATTSFLKDTFGTILSYSEYFYDANNFKIEEKTYSPGGNQIARKQWTILTDNVYYFTISDSLNAQNNAEVGYTYSFDNVNTAGNDNIGLRYYGKSSKNVERSLHKTSSTTGNIYYTFQYTFDNGGRISSKTAYNHLSELVYTNTYTYN